MSLLIRPHGDEVASYYGPYFSERLISMVSVGDKLEALCKDGLNYHVEVKYIDASGFATLHFIRWSKSFDWKGSLNNLYLTDLGRYSFCNGITKLNRYPPKSDFGWNSTRFQMFESFDSGIEKQRVGVSSEQGNEINSTNQPQDTGHSLVIALPAYKKRRLAAEISRWVDCFDRMTGKLVHRFASVEDAIITFNHSHGATDIHAEEVIAVCNGRADICHGYRWRWCTDEATAESDLETGDIGEDCYKSSVKCHKTGQSPHITRAFDSVSADTTAAAAGEFDRERKKVKVMDHDMLHSGNMSTVDRVSNSAAADSLNGRRVGHRRDGTDPLGSEAAHEAKTQIALLGIAADRGGARAACGPDEGQGMDEESKVAATVLVSTIRTIARIHNAISQCTKRGSGDCTRSTSGSKSSSSSSSSSSCSSSTVTHLKHAGYQSVGGCTVVSATESASATATARRTLVAVIEELREAVERAEKGLSMVLGQLEKEEKGEEEDGEEDFGAQQQWRPPAVDENDADGGGDGSVRAVVQLRAQKGDKFVDELIAKDTIDSMYARVQNLLVEPVVQVAIEGALLEFQVDERNPGSNWSNVAVAPARAANFSGYTESNPDEAVGEESTKRSFDADSYDGCALSSAASAGLEVVLTKGEARNRGSGGKKSKRLQSRRTS